MASPATAGATAYGQALPPGWEAKYDPGQRRYFYINHSTQTTSWDDPRPAYYRQFGSHNNMYRMQSSPRPSPHMPQPQHLPQPQRSPAMAGRLTPTTPRAEAIPMKEMSKSGWQKEVEDKYNLKVNTLTVDDEDDAASNVSPHTPRSSRAPSPRNTPAASNQRTEETSFIQAYEEKVQKLRTMFPTADETIIKQFLVKNHNSEPSTISDLQQAGFQRQDAAHVQLMVTRIKREFPAAEAGIIRDILHGVSNNESKAKQELKSLGYQQASATNRSTGSLRGRGTSPARSPSPAVPASGGKKNSRQELLSKTTSPNKELSSLERTKLKRKMAQEFPDQSASTIEMALDVCHYDEGRVRTLIQSMATTQQAKNIVSRMGLSVDSEGRRSPSPRQTTASPAPGTSSGNTFTFPDTAPGPSLATASTGSSMATSGTSAFSSMKFPTTSSSITSTSKVTATSRPSRTRSPVRRPAESRRAPPVINRSTGPFVSTNLTQPMGSNQQLVMGPDRSILIEEYMNNKGPDESLVSGANSELVSGPTTPVSGPDSDVLQGADPNITSGPDPSLVAGPSGARGAAEGVGRGGVCHHFMNTLCRSMGGSWGSSSV